MPLRRLPLFLRCAVRETGTGALFGLGYDNPLGSAASLSTFWNGAANFGQLGIGVTIH